MLWLTAEDMDEAMSMSPTGSMSSRHVFDLLGERGSNQTNYYIG